MSNLEYGDRGPLDEVTVWFCFYFGSFSGKEGGKNGRTANYGSCANNNC